MLKSTDELRQQARENHLKGDTEAAIILLTNAIAANPKDMFIALDMVQIFLDINALTQAKDLFNRLGEVAQKTDIGISIASQLNFKNLAKKTAGIEALQNAILKNPDDCQSRFDLAVCLFAQHDTEQAMEALFFIQKNNADFKNDAALEMIVMVCNMLATTNKTASESYRSRLSALLNP